MFDVRRFDVLGSKFLVRSELARCLALNVERRTGNAERRTSNLEPRTAIT